jgi:hypothetical protein
MSLLHPLSHLSPLEASDAGALLPPLITLPVVVDAIGAPIDRRRTDSSSVSIGPLAAPAAPPAGAGGEAPRPAAAAPRPRPDPITAHSFITALLFLADDHTAALLRRRRLFVVIRLLLIASLVVAPFTTAARRARRGA